MTHDEMIEVIQAHKEGKAIERRRVDILNDESFGEWQACSIPVDRYFNFYSWEYRVKPEPFECWGAIGEDGKYFGAWTDREVLERAMSASCGPFHYARIVKLREA